MIVNVFTKNRQAQYGAQSTASIHSYYGNVVGGLCTLEELCDKLDLVINFLRQQGFRREQISRKQLWDRQQKIFAICHRQLTISIVFRRIC